MKKLILLFSLVSLIAAFSRNTAKSSASNSVKEITFLTKYNNTIWTNGFESHKFSDSFRKEVDCVLPICDTCVLPTLECHMCGYTWMKDEVNKFSFGSNYQNDFFYEENSTLFFEDSNFIMWNIYYRSGYKNSYESGKIKWIPVNSDSSAIKKIQLKNKPILDLFKFKKEEEFKLIEIEFENY